MATATVKYFSGEVELKGVYGIDTKKFIAIGGIKSKHNYFDSFKRMVGTPKDDAPALMLVTRAISYKKNPSLHVCDSRCRCAKGGNCECSCGGKYHGVDA